MRIRLANISLIVSLGILLTGAAWFAYRAHETAMTQQELKQDYSLSNSVTFGLFSVDQWRDRLSEVMDHQINGYSITPEQQKEIQLAVEKQLHILIAKTIAEIDKPQKSLGGKLKKMAFHTLADSDDLQKQVRPFALTIVRKISSPASESRLKGIATSKIGQLEKQTYDHTFEASDKVSKFIAQKYHIADAAAFDQLVKARLGVIRSQTIKNVLYLLACVLAALVLWWLVRRKVGLQTTLFVMSLLFAAVLLAAGLTLPIIEVDARIQSLNFMLLGEKVAFENQVLFFQSKSIWDIITTLLSQHKPDAITVGMLVLLFIVILPFLRLTARGLRQFVQNNRVVNYLAFEAGKWDMADVMIVGVLMTYIGLNGILKSQLANLNIHNDTLTAHTVNFTSLQPGYFVFVAYVLFDILLSYILKKTTPEEVRPKKKKYKTRHLRKSATQ